MTKSPHIVKRPLKGGDLMALSVCIPITDATGQEITAHGTDSFPVAFYDDDFSFTNAWMYAEGISAVS